MITSRFSPYHLESIHFVISQLQFNINENSYNVNIKLRQMKVILP